MSTKDTALRAMAITVLTLEMRIGHKKWKVTELAKCSGYSRGLVYQYLGSTKDSILRNALEVFLPYFYASNDENLREGLGEKVADTRALLKEYPDLILFYQKWRANEDSWIGEALVKAEKRFRAQVRKQIPGLTPLQVTLFQALLHGLVTAPFLEVETAAKGGRELDRLLKGL